MLKIKEVCWNDGIKHLFTIDKMSFILRPESAVKKVIHWGILFGIVASLSIFLGCSSRPSYPVIQKGKLYLTGWDFAQYGNVPLDGDWEFHWLKLLTPEDIENNPKKTNPLIFIFQAFGKGDQTNGRQLSAEGYATYRLTVKVVPDETIKSLIITRPLSVCKLWINGKLMAESVRIGVDREETVDQLLGPLIH